MLIPADTSSEIGANRSAQGVYRVVDGKPIPAAVPGQSMPDGGVFGTMRYVSHVNDDIAGLNCTDGLGAANLKEEIPFLATLEDGTPALNVIEPDGTLTPILQQGQVTNAGTTTRLGIVESSAGWSPAAAINDNGEIAVSMEIDNGPRSVAILTPPGP